MQVRQYRAADRAALIDLWTAVFPDDPPHNAPAAVLDAKLAVDDLIYVAIDGDELIGACMAGYDGHRGWLYAVAVAPDRRRAGVGRQLVERTVGALGERGCIKVNLQIRSTNRDVAAFYRSLGFVVENRVSMGKLIG